MGVFLPFGGHKCFSGSKRPGLGAHLETLGEFQEPTLFQAGHPAWRCWSSALHGIVGVVVSDSNIANLRSAAVKALHIHSAGSDPLIRLLSFKDMLADPGFFQMWEMLREFRRMLAKLPSLLMDWTRCVKGHSGLVTHGPFAKIHHVFAQASWAILEPPSLQCHSIFCVGEQRMHSSSMSADKSRIAGLWRTSEASSLLCSTWIVISCGLWTWRAFGPFRRGPSSHHQPNTPSSMLPNRASALPARLRTPWLIG